MFDGHYEDEGLVHEPVYLCNECGEDMPESELLQDTCPYCESTDLEQL